MIKSALQSSLTNDVKYSSMSAGTVPSSEYLIETVVLSSSASSVTFSNLAQYAGVYRHLQIVFLARHSESTAGIPDLLVQFNGDTGSNYFWHMLSANGSSLSSFALTSRQHFRIGQTPKNNETSGAFHVGIVDILDPFKTNKNTTIKSLNGRVQTTNQLGLISGAWNNTSAVNSMLIFPDTTTMIAGSRFSLYGVN